MNWFFDALIRLLFPPKCSACGELLASDENLICRDCLNDYEAAAERSCPQCLKPLHTCTCPNRFLDRHGVHKLIKLFSYRPRNTHLSTNCLVFRLKRCDSEAAIRFLSEKLALEIQDQLEPGKKYVLTGVPRSQGAIRLYGDDHIRLLCTALSKILHIPYVSAVRRVGREGVQKKKNYRERMSSARVSYAPNDQIDLHGYHVILIDDIVTSGATLAACAAAIRCCGARNVIAAVVGSSFRYQNLIGSKQYYREKNRNT